MATFQVNPDGIDELLPMLDKAPVVVPECDDTAVWELKPLNSFCKRPVDSIHLSKMPRDSSEAAWASSETTPIDVFDPAACAPNYA